VTYRDAFVDEALAAALLPDFTQRFATEARRHVTNAETEQSYKLSRRTLVLVDPAQLDALSLVIPKIWGDDVTVIPFTLEADAVRKKIEALTGFTFNICLVNYYANGNDAIAFHSDQEERGSTSCIASLSLGAERPFAFRRIGEKETLEEVTLNDRSLLIMGEGCQETYQHALLRCKACKDPRLNMTFRLFEAERYAAH
jgi:hypothetical protein